MPYPSAEDIRAYQAPEPKTETVTDPVTGWDFTLRQVISAAELMGILQQATMRRDLPVLPQAGGEPLSLPPDLAFNCQLVAGCLVEPRLEYADVVLLSTKTGGLITQLAMAASRLNLMTEEEAGAVKND